MIYYNYGGYTVTRAHMLLELCGVELTYPGMSVINGQQFVFDDMEIFATRASRYFVSTAAYRSDRVICVSPGYFVLEFDFNIGGREYLDDVYMDPYNDDLKDT